MAVMKTAEDIRTWFDEVRLERYLTDDEIKTQHQKAEQLQCGYSMLRRKPWTFEASSFIPYGEIVVIDFEYLAEQWTKQMWPKKQGLHTVAYLEGQ